MTSGARPPVRVEHATLVAAITPGASPAGEASRRQACKAIAAQVYRVVAAVLGPASADVGDLAQEAFIRIYNAIPTFGSDGGRPGAASAWVNKIALHVALDRVRHLRHRAEDLDVDLGRFAGRDDDVDESLDNERLAAALLERLDEKERAVLVLRYWSEATDEEIAEALAIPLGTVKTRIRTASAKLRGAAPLASAGGPTETRVKP